VAGDLPGDCHQPDLAVFAFNLVGDTLRDAWDPKLRRMA
jgi:hypothetical protein